MPTWDVHPSVAYVQSILRNLEANTGKDLDAWVALVHRKGPKEEKARREWLKAQGLGGTQASFVAERSMGEQSHAFDGTPERYLALAPSYVDQQYSGKKAALRPLFEQLLTLTRALGPDIRICPCETIVPIYREHVIAQVKPFASRLDFCLALGDPALLKDPSGRLLDTGGFKKKDRLTVRMEVRSEADIDGTLKTWLKRAYERDASSSKPGKGGEKTS
jgi:hypothetical protein